MKLKGLKKEAMEIVIKKFPRFYWYTKKRKSKNISKRIL